VTNALLAEIEAARKVAAKVSFKKTGQTAADILCASSDAAPGEPVSAEQVSTSLGALRAKFGKKR
jgi:hypothetical protein